MERNRKCGPGRFAPKVWQCSAVTFLCNGVSCFRWIGTGESLERVYVLFPFSKNLLMKKKQIESLEEDYGWVKDKYARGQGLPEVEEKEAVKTQRWQHCQGQDHGGSGNRKTATLPRTGHRCTPVCQHHPLGLTLGEWEDSETAW